MRQFRPGTDLANPADHWIEAARAGDDGHEAMGRALETCRRYLLLVAERELGADLRTKAGASDLVQETFLNAQRDFGRFQGRTEAELRAWLRRILKNNLANLAERYRRTGKRQMGLEVSLDSGAIGSFKESLAAETPSPSVQAVGRERVVALGRALDRLPEHYRRVFEWRHRQGCSFEEIGLRLGGSADAARKVWARALQRLQGELGALDGA